MSDPNPLPRDLPAGIDSPEEMGDIFDAPSRQERELYSADMDDHDVPEDYREAREWGFQHGWTRAYYLLTNTPKAEENAKQRAALDAVLSLTGDLAKAGDPCALTLNDQVRATITEALA